MARTLQLLIGNLRDRAHYRLLLLRTVSNGHYFLQTYGFLTHHNVEGGSPGNGNLLAPHTHKRELQNRYIRGYRQAEGPVCISYCPNGGAFTKNRYPRKRKACFINNLSRECSWLGICTN